ncbi:hypothetical protein M569_01834 [Genlisea aurea]|uniref:Uncharacterized protein n=1 Tax=Genlisea aurea TaxID=192259 RepID=S8CZL5_9LAMI|nr:hypothetical protein M569_01834 [Genlisea aurea]
MGGGGKEKSAEDDELALAKSAAWAWYQRGSAADCRSAREFEAWRKRINGSKPKPSRYRLEAMRRSGGSPSPVPSARSSSANSLLDTYEVERISNLLEYYIETTQKRFRSAEVETKSNQIKTQGKAKGGAWFIPSCRSSKHDVIESQQRLIRSRPAPEKGYSSRRAGRCA